MSYCYGMPEPLRLLLIALTLAVLPITFAVLGLYGSQPLLNLATSGMHLHVGLTAPFRHLLALIGLGAGLLEDAHLLLDR